MSMRPDVQYALRALRRQPGFTAAAVATLAIGIGAATSIFTVVDGLLLKALPYPDPHRVVAIHTRWIDSGRVTPRTTGGDLEDLRQEAAFEAFSYYHGGEVGVQLETGAEFIAAYRVDPDFFHVFSVPPVAGRTFRPDDAGRAAVVSDGFARRHYGGAFAAIGHSLQIDGTVYDVIGVMPSLMQFPRLAQVWASDGFTPSNTNRSGYNYYAVGKLRPGISPADADGRLLALADRLALAFPDTNRARTFDAVPLQDELTTPIRSTLLLLIGAVGLLLLIACANVANLALARATIREREFAVRAALGAGWWEQLSPALAESVVIGLVAGVAGIAIAAVATRALLRMGAHFVPAPLVPDVHLDERVLGFAVGASCVSAFVAIVPAWRMVATRTRSALTAGGPLGIAVARSSRVRSALVVAQIALSVTLAIDASLLFRTLAALHEAHLGYRTEGVLVTYAHVPARTLSEGLEAGRLFDEFFARLRGVTGVVSTAGAMGLPAGQYDAYGSYAIEGKQAFDSDPRQLPSAGFRLTSPGYFSTMGIPVIRGRDFDERDIYDRPFVVIISESLARQQFPGDDPIGHRIICGLTLDPKWMTVVGVVGDVRQHSPASRPGPELYMPLRQYPFHANEVEVVVRTSRDPAAMVTAVQRTIRQVSPDVAMKSATLNDLVDDSVSAERFRSALAGVFAIVALLLAVSGTYAVTSYVTVCRTAEFGLRSALGARPAHLVASVLASAIRLAALGAAVGTLGAAATTQLLATMLFGVSRTSPSHYALVVSAVLPVIALAAALPAWRASRVDPMMALRAN